MSEVGNKKPRKRERVTSVNLRVYRKLLFEPAPKIAT